LIIIPVYDYAFAEAIFGVMDHVEFRRFGLVIWLLSVPARWDWIEWEGKGNTPWIWEKIGRSGKKVVFGTALDRQCLYVAGHSDRALVLYRTGILLR
jgi:hypothetical protein